MAGELTLVGVPIGNISDISMRAISLLQSVDLLACEDTRRAGKLLMLLRKHSQERGIKWDQNPSQQLISYRDQNHEQMVARLLSFLREGRDLVLISDSGMPTISDPGFKLVEAAISAGYEVDVVPGPTAVTTAVAISGLPTDTFSFLGFLPRQKSKAAKTLKAFGDLPATLVIYESPFRVTSTLQRISEVLGDRSVTIVKELTKLHQQVWRGRVEEVLAELGERRLKGEFVILVGKEGYSFT